MNAQLEVITVILIVELSVRTTKEGSGVSAAVLGTGLKELSVLVCRGQ